MITSRLKSPETPEFSVISLRKGNAPINAVLSKNIPPETLIPLKDLVKYKSNLNDNNNINDLGKHLSPEIEGFNIEINSLQSTIIAGSLGLENFSDGSDKKAKEHKTTIFSNEVCKMNKTFDIITYESPVEIFQRMKNKSLQFPPKQSVADSSSSTSLDLRKSQRDVILSPVLPEKGEPPISSGRKGSFLANEAPLINTSNKIFLPVQQKVPHQQEHQCYQNITYDITTSEERHENISTSVILSGALARSARIIQDDENRFMSDNLYDSLILESIDANEERPQSTNINGITPDCVPVNTGTQLSKCDSEMSTKRLLEQEMSEDNEKISETIQEMSEVLNAAPKTQIVAPEKKISKGSTSISHANKNTSTTKTKEICLQKWMIRNMNNNTAVCVEGKLIDTPDLYWHSNAIVERLDYNRLRTISGNVYILKGTIDTISMKEAGFPANFTRKFIFGFPKNWKQYVDDLLQELRTCMKKGKKCKFDHQEIDENGIEMISKNARNTIVDVPKKCSEIPTEGDTLPRATDEHRKVPLKLWCADHNNFDNQINVTLQLGGKNCLSKEESSAKNESKQIMPPKKSKNHEAKINETAFKSLKRVKKNVIKDTTQELIESSDTESSKEEFLSDTEKMECMNNIEKKLTVTLTPMRSRKVLEQKCKDHNLSLDTIKRITELALPRNKVENGGTKADLRKNKNKRFLRSLEKTFGNSLEYKSEDEEDADIYADSERKIKRSSRLKGNEPSGYISSSKIQTKITELSSQESETEEESRKKTQVGMKTRQKATKKTVDLLKCKRKDNRKSPVILEHASEESDKDDHSKTKKPTSSSNKIIQKIDNRRKFSVVEVIGSRRTKEQPLECFPDLIKEENWTEKELQKFQGTWSPVPKQKRGFRGNVATTRDLRNAEESQKKHMEDHLGKSSRKRAIKKMVPSLKVLNGHSISRIPTFHIE
ncbi:mis18-binding protein 1-like isoform X2 [Macrotis lagotis]|uniref:mis18-binding protein 1-like isoform X2 n=1 Tax=Macrotis lagotis TaxID=92651 RepID=UPI003D6817C4